ncbi:ABC transporter ATP-binding protein [Streptococcus panodentis]|uniref:ABC transporter n=1 Tax=Streptococcus panodentis TaxID=1581472 RepID=A0ABS5AZ90_9STRE|nr:ABC transporter ATP-binding protein [Streptococcus panodentis]MBP2621894.1 ABC transporter [Streptococcus panodentis]
MKLEMIGISKSYGSKSVLKNISCEFTEGVYGLLGANGTGKTTLMNIICNLIKPSQGRIKFDDLAHAEDYIQYIGLLPQNFSYYPSFTGLDFLLYMAVLKGMAKKAAVEESGRLLKLVGLYDVRKKKIASYSGGMKQRLGIAQALLNDPKILILDEPTVGLDPKERVKFRNIISELSADKIILLSTHIVSDVEAIAKEILILKDGNFIERGSARDLLSPIEDQVWEFRLSESDWQRLSQDYVIVNERVEPDGVVLRVISAKAPAENARQAVPSLEDLYIYHFREEAV